MADKSEPRKYGERGVKFDRSKGGARGNTASSQSGSRKPPQGGSGTAPPKDKGK